MLRKFSKDRNFTDRKLSAAKFLPGIISFVILVVLLVLPEDSFPQDEEWLQISFADKIAHSFIFGITTFLLLLPIANSDLYKKFKRHYFIRIAVSMCIWGITTEFIQKFFIPSRSFDLLDWAADSFGILVATLYTWRYHRR